MARELNSREDIIRRYDQSICMVKGEPVYVRVHPREEVVEPEHKIRIYKMPSNLDGRGGLFDYRKDEFQAGPIELGYMFLRDRAIYVQRMPVRQNTHGLTHRCCIFTPDVPLGVREFTGGDMVNCILGRHKSLEEALNILRDREAESVPIHRHLAIFRDGNQVLLKYRTRFVGMKYPDRDEFYLFESKDRSFIERDIDRTGVKLWVH